MTTEYLPVKDVIRSLTSKKANSLKEDEPKENEKLTIKYFLQLNNPSFSLRNDPKTVKEQIGASEGRKNGEDRTKNNNRTILKDVVFSKGLKFVLESCYKEELAVLYSAWSEEGEDTKGYNKASYAKRLKRVIEGSRIDFFTQISQEERAILHELLKTDIKLDENKYAESIIDEINRIGLEYFLKDLPAATLSYYCEKSGFVNVSTVNDMVTTVLTGVEPAKISAPKKKITYSKTKLPLSSKLKYQDIFQHYYVVELQDYCKAHKLSPTGTKKVLILRIMNFLAGHVEKTKKEKREEKAALKPKSTKKDKVTKKGLTATTKAAVDEAAPTEEIEYEGEVTDEEGEEEIDEAEKSNTQTVEDDDSDAEFVAEEKEPESDKEAVSAPKYLTPKKSTSNLTKKKSNK
ncbi:hypothetical protein CYY_008043 [Polysphondylium violaceum]|uniref:SAP domain-containing protein n=1 Tax=Polysphondylium violaceum TaxID=133409 RepID=A0A8J4UXL4_9MYCE|nr:hypothetical protein CYY_008043 [Polysphondylium violaceum]